MSSVMMLLLGAVPYAQKPVELWELSNTESNYGVWGDANSLLPSLTWPSGSGAYYLWEGRLWLGALVGSDTLVTHSDYGNYEWEPSVENDTSGFIYVGPGVSDMDVYTAYDDYVGNNQQNVATRHLGVKVFQRSLKWADGPVNAFFGYEFAVTYDSSECDVIGKTDTLRGVILAFDFDHDVCGADNFDPNIDDLVLFDGWVNSEWDTLTYSAPVDTLTITADSAYAGADGVLDAYQLFGDDPFETTVMGDTLRVPRGMSYMYDWDNPAEAGGDIGDGGACAGYVGLRVLYAPPAPSDSTGGGVRVVRPLAHQWWDWESDPTDDIAKYRVMAGVNPRTAPYRYAPSPLDLGDSAFDYRHLLSFGPYDVADGDTLKFVLAAAVGQGLSGGVDTVYYGGRGWLRGLRQASDYAMDLYYCGATASDPAHPSDFDSDTHWQTDCFTLTAASERATRPSLSLSVASTLFRSWTTVTLTLPARGDADVCVYDAGGRLVARPLSGTLSAGTHETRVGQGLASGVYLVRASDGVGSRVVRLVKVR